MNKKIALGIVIYKQQILIVRRKEKEGKLLWQFPGGEVLDNETGEQAVIRELREETGLSCKTIKLLGERMHPYTKREMSYWACEYCHGKIEISDEDLDRAIWIPINKLDDYFTTDIYESVRTYIKSY